MPLIPDDYQERDILHAGPSAGLGEDNTPAAFGQGVAASLNVAGEIATRVHYDAANAANQTAVMDRMNQVEQAKQTILRDPKQGLLYQQTGAQSPGAAQKALSDFQQQAGQARAGLANDQQREDFDRKFGLTLDHMRAETDGYVGSQLDKHTDDVYSTAHQLQLSATAHDPSEAPIQIAKLQGSVEQYAVAKGYAPGTEAYTDFVADQTRKGSDQIHATAIQAYLAQDNPSAAKAYLNQNRASITDPGILRNAEDTTKAAGVEQQGQNIALGYLQGTQSFGETVGGSEIPGSGGLFDRKAFNDQVDADPRLQADVRLRDAVVRNGNAMIEQHQRAVDEAHNQNFQTVFAAQSKGNGVTSTDMAALQATLPPEQQEALNRHARELVAPQVKAQEDVDQAKGDQAYGDFFVRANEDPAFLKRMTAADLYSRYYNTFSDKQYAHAVDMLGKAHKPDEFGQNDVPGTDGVTDTGPNSDVYNMGKAANLDSETMGRFAPAAAQALEDAQDANGDKPLTEEQKQKAVGPLLVQSIFVPQPRTWMGWAFNDPIANRQVPAALLTPDDRKKLPPALLQRIDAQTRAAGAPDPRDVDTFLRSRAGNKQN